MSCRFSPPSFYSSSDDFQTPAQSTFDKFNGSVDSTMTWAVIESIDSFKRNIVLYSHLSATQSSCMWLIRKTNFCSYILFQFSVSGVVVLIAIIAIVYTIIECLKKAGAAIPAYTQLPSTEKKPKASKSFPSTREIEVVMPPDSTVQGSKAEFATMERFLSNINKEKPIRFSPEQLDVITWNYSTILGSGAFGVVYKGELSKGEYVAVKVIKSLDKGMKEQFKAEVSTIGRTYHINLVKLYGFCFHRDKRALVYEYVENGSLNKYLFGSQNRDIELGKLHEIAIGTAKGIAYLHEECQQRIIHYDIKPENVLLDMNLKPKVADFGLAKLCSREDNVSVNTHFRGTMGYAAPEMWKPYPVTHKCDVYSFGILLFEIVGRRRHFDDNCSESQQWFPKWTWDMFENNELSVMLSLCGIEGKEREKAERMSKVALWCVQYSPDDRPLMSTVVKMLEGEIEISPPPFPFQKLESGKPKLTPPESSIESGSKTKHNTFWTQAQSTFDNFSQSVDSTMKWAVIESIISGVVVLIAIIAIVYAIIECLKKAGEAIPAYVQVSSKEKDDKDSNSFPSTSEFEVVVIPPNSTVQGSKAEFATMERFLSNINKEKPIRFSPEQLDVITWNYSTILGSGAFGVVYKGELSNGEHVAVKVINSLDMGMEEQFKAEVGTIGRTYHSGFMASASTMRSELLSTSVWKMGLSTLTCLEARTEALSLRSFIRLQLEQQKELLIYMRNVNKE
ncbi:LEAF RUST 10 DISEASE-RESISTANCE LOCUS RECEPTOR-LIKE PROTEIN KINASE-like 2.2, partial [Mucuna pruriens]